MIEREPPPSNTWYDETKLPLPLSVADLATRLQGWWVSFHEFRKGRLELLKMPSGIIGVTTKGKYRPAERAWLYFEAADQVGDVVQVEWIAEIKRLVWYRLELARSEMKDLYGFSIYSKGGYRRFTIFTPPGGKAMVTKG